MRISRHGIALASLMLLAAFVFTLGISWGLPSRQDDRYLLGADNHGAYLEALTAKVPEIDPSRGANVVAPTGEANAIVPLNDTDEKRAQILCRYRLYSYQPDEMITFRALSLMKPRALQFDPRLYQYGGLWIYPVGGLIEIGHLFGLVQIANRATYIKHPELFGRFYVIARAYSAAWGVLGVWAVYLLVRRMSGGAVFDSTIAAVYFISMPVIINAAHEAKPHLAGTVLVLLAVLAGDNWIQNGKSRWIWITGILCGAAAGMVLWAFGSFLIVPVMVLLRKETPKARLLNIARAFAAMICVYAIANPYVILHLLRDPSVLKSNLGNTAGMYQISLSTSALLSAYKLIVAGGGVWMISLMPMAFFFMSWRARGVKILTVLAIVYLCQFTLTAAGKPGEYGRLAILPDVLLVLIACAPMARSQRRPSTLNLILLVLLMIMVSLFQGFPYGHGFWRDAGGAQQTSRWMSASDLDQALSEFESGFTHTPGQINQSPRPPVLGIYADPAPYCLPPVDLTNWNIVRLPRDYDAQKNPAAIDLIARPEEISLWGLGGTPLSWADKQFEIIKK